MAYRILNPETARREALDSQQVAARLKQAINGLKGNFYDLDTGKVSYSAMKGSEAYGEYLEAAAQLRYLDLSSLQTQDQRLAFWINLYNALVVHGIIELGVENSVREIGKFFETVAYQVGPHTLSLDGIEHGILRRNQKKHLFAWRLFGNGDPRLALMVHELEPRIHFTLVCGSKSCPPIGTYQEEKMAKQLELAASSFINSDNVQVDKDKRQLRLSKIFDWYGKDFGNKAQLLEFIAGYRRDPAEQAWIREQGSRVGIQWLDYDWGLNT